MSNYDAGAPAEGGEGNGYDRQRSPAPERRGEDEFGREAGGAPGSGSPAGRDGDRERERERSPDDRRRERDASPRRRPPPPPPGRNQEAPPSNVLGCFGLSIRTRDVDLEDEFARYGKVEKAVVVYDQRSERSRGFGFVTMATQEDAQLCIEKLNGIELHGRNIRVAFSQTQKPHQSTPGEYMGFKTQGGGGGRRFDDRGPPPRRDDRDRYRRDDRDGGRGFGGRGGGYGGGRDRDYDRDDRDYRRRDDYDDRRRRDDSPPRRRDDRDYDRYGRDDRY